MCEKILELCRKATVPHHTAHLKLNIFLTALELGLPYMCTKAAFYMA
jgi:hypothetical protein